MGAGRSREVEAVGTGEYFSLSQIDDPQKLIATLIDTILEKGELAHEKFLNCLANLQYTFLGLEPISKYLGDDSNSGPVHPEGAGFLDKKKEPDDPEIMASSVRKGLPGSPSAGTPSKERRDKSSEDATTSLEEKKGAEGLEDTASPSEKGKRAKTLEDEAMPSEKKRSMSPEGATTPSKERMGAEVSRNVIASLEKRPGAKTTAVVATASEEGKGQENLEEVTTTSDNGNRAPEQFLLQTQEELTALWSLGNTLELTPVGDELPESTPVKKQEEATPLRTSAIGTLVKTSADEKTLGKPSDIIRKERKRLIEILLRDLELSLDEFISQSVITEEEYETLDKAEEDLKKKSRKLLILVQKKGESTCQKFLECLKIVSPGLDEELQYLSYVEEADTPRVPERAEGDLLKDPLKREETWEWSAHEGSSGWCPRAGPCPGAAGAGTLSRAEEEPREEGPVNLELQGTPPGRQGEGGFLTRDPGQLHRGQGKPPKQELREAFEDVAVYFTQKEWELLGDEDKELYRNQMLRNYQALVSLGAIDSLLQSLSTTWVSRTIVY
ncbi:hypothetical protein Y1Q_0006972 [Alligator mississippiensis]|uniref:Uncharacterized protein n=1 Tax=Alligator mississippiensis TaxID=8496 RepID=A0A151MNW1_ALLMI|nr:hypothetical protein Y1Q_0006972 [Alligator mississippiensis]